MEDSIHEALVVSNILTVSSDKSNFNLYNQFKYFVPSTQKFHAFPSQGEFYLVEWKIILLEKLPGTKGPYLIITDIEHIDFYKDNIRRYIPNALVTYITENSSDNSIYDILLKELYVEDTTLIRSSFVIMTDQSFRFKNKTHFDFL
ncbi:hypothetical protein QTN25_009183 [Entamoeba marina]